MKKASAKSPVRLCALLALLVPSLVTPTARAQSWSHITDIPALTLSTGQVWGGARLGPAAATGRDGRIYLIGGDGAYYPWENGYTSYSLPFVFAYTPATNTWTRVADLNTPRRLHGAATGRDGRVYAIGGQRVYNQVAGLINVLSSVEVYDPVANRWTAAASLPTARFGFGTTVGADGRIYVIGGANNVGQILKSVEVYDPATNRWTSVASLNIGRAGCAAATGPDGRLYAIGGVGASLVLVGSQWIPEYWVEPSVEVYDPAANTWTFVASMSTPRKYPAAAVGPDGRIYVSGGKAGVDNVNDVLPSVEAYNPITGTWSTAASLPQRWTHASVAGPDGRIYAVGGTPDYDPTVFRNWLSDVEAYYPAPRLDAVTPNPVLAGSPSTTVTASGAWFHSGASLCLNGSPLTTTYLSSTSLRATIPASRLAVGGTMYAVTAVNPLPSPEASNPITFTVSYQVPTITGVSPNPILVGGATAMAVNGAGFGLGSVVRVNGTSVATSFVSTTRLNAAIPATNLSNSGTLSISVINPAPGGGTSNTFSLPVFYGVPTLSNAWPSTIYAGSSDTMATLRGTGFGAGSIVKVNGVNVAAAYVSATSLGAVIPASCLTNPRSLSISVFNPAPGGGTSNALSITVTTAVTPRLTSVNPSTLYAGSLSTIVSLTGTGFAGGSVVQVNGVTFASTILSATQMSVFIPSADLVSSGTLGITVVNPAPAGKSNARAVNVVYAKPTLSDVSPNYAQHGSFNALVRLDGTGFARASAVYANGVKITALGGGSGYIASTLLQASIPYSLLNRPGTLNLTVVNPAPGGGTSNAFTFTVR